MGLITAALSLGPQAVAPGAPPPVRRCFPIVLRCVIYYPGLCFHDIVMMSRKSFFFKLYASQKDDYAILKNIIVS